MKVPAICDNCGAIFPSSFEVTNCKDITFAGCESGPCPACGGKGHIPDGTYNFIGSTIELLSGPNRTVSELERLATILIEIRNQDASLQQTTQKISEEIPELYSLTQVLPKTRSELYAFIAIFLTIITIILGQLKNDSKQNIEINQVINKIYQQQTIEGK